MGRTGFRGELRRRDFKRYPAKKENQFSVPCQRPLQRVRGESSTGYHKRLGSGRHPNQGYQRRNRSKTTKSQNSLSARSFCPYGSRADTGEISRQEVLFLLLREPARPRTDVRREGARRSYPPRQAKVCGRRRYSSFLSVCQKRSGHEVPAQSLQGRKVPPNQRTDSGSDGGWPGHRFYRITLVRPSGAVLCGRRTEAESETAVLCPLHG